mmetsp:Transcript_26926/g.59586  ORF Transcript_26926/g.59586 Transcript_26926/m.59586 type:complete len:226 (-) Transcript_26926:867-1544(-)
MHASITLRTSSVVFAAKQSSISWYWVSGMRAMRRTWNTRHFVFTGCVVARSRYSRASARPSSSSSAPGPAPAAVSAPLPVPAPAPWVPLNSAGLSSNPSALITPCVCVLFLLSTTSWKVITLPLAIRGRVGGRAARREAIWSRCAGPSLAPAPVRPTRFTLYRPCTAISAAPASYNCWHNSKVSGTLSSSLIFTNMGTESSPALCASARVRTRLSTRSRSSGPRR